MEHRAQAAPKPQTGRLRSYPAGASETEQDEPLATYEGWCRDAEAHINWHGHIDTIYNLIRGCNPSPGALTTVVGRKLRIFDVRKYPIRRYGEVTGRPGEICQIDEQGSTSSVRAGVWRS
jgi:methionyl-tRNA formyltransferase